jgi:predicted ATPase
VFAGGFTLEAASAVIASDEMTPYGIVNHVVNLVAKSLVATEAGSPDTRYRLLETTRAYALEKLSESGERGDVARRHAAYFQDLLERAETETGEETSSVTAWAIAYGRDIGDVRAALDWAFSPAGDAAIGVALTVAAVPLWTRWSLMEECRRRTEEALRLAPLDKRREMQLLAGLAPALLATRGPRPDITAAWASVLKIAESVNDSEHRLRALWGLYIDRYMHGDFRAALGFAERFRQLATDAADTASLLVCDRMIGTALHALGDLGGARTHIEYMLDNYVAPSRRLHLHVPYDQRVLARCWHSQILWQQGAADQAVQIARSNVVDARAIEHLFSLRFALVNACSIELLTGDLAAASGLAQMLFDNIWNVWGRCFSAVLLIRRGEVASGAERLQAALTELPAGAFLIYYNTFVAELARAQGLAGQVAQGLATLEAALARAVHNEELWYMAEFLRVQGELTLLQDPPNATPAAEALFRKSIDWASRQGALSWELRAATSLARLYRTHARSNEARAVLAPVYRRFSEGFATADLREAKALLDKLP